MNKNRLIIVAGAGGAGKSFFLRKWTKLDENAFIIKKYVSAERCPRRQEIELNYSDLIYSNKYNPKTSEGKSWYAQNFPDLPLPKKLEFHNRQITLMDGHVIYPATVEQI